MTLRTFAKRTASALRNLTIALAFAAFGAVGVTAQNTGTVTGLVRDAVSLAPLAGAQVSIEGTGVGGLVNNVGRFLLLNVPAGEQTVNVTLIGYSPASQTVTVAAGETATVDFRLREQALSLEGVIVTGTAGQARRREVGNTVESISSGDIEIAAVTSANEVLQGRAAGLQISTSDGQVGSGSEIRIRGNSSLTQNNRPLIYIDGVRMQNTALGSTDEAGVSPGALDGINPSDIDRVEIVKGPAATTLYGTEAAGGVVQIFTKRGSAGAAAWTLNVEGGMTRMPHQGPKTADDVNQIQNQYIDENPDLFPTGDLDVDYLLPDGSIGNDNGLRLNDCASGEDMSMYSTLDGYGPEPGCPEDGSWFRDAYQQRYNLSVRGGGETATYFVSGRYADEQGVVDPQGQDSYNVRANIQFQPVDGLDISLNNMYTRRNTVWVPNGNNASGLYLNVLRGERGYTPNNDDSLVLVNDITSAINQWVTSASVGWSPTASLSHRLNFGMDYTFHDFQDFKPFGNYENPQGDRENDAITDRNFTFDYNGSWRTDITDQVSSSFSWGGQLYEELEYRLNGFDALFAGPGDQLLGDGTLPGVNESRITVRSGGFFVQEQVGISDRLFVTGGVRWDGFSTFGEGFGLAAYPKVSAAWTISEESFFPQPDAMDAVKLRGAWGQSGRAPGAFDAVRVWNATQADEFVPAVIIGNLGNADLGPEISEEIEAGFETSWFQSRLTLDFTWYKQNTTDALVGVPPAPSFGTEQATLRNIGETEVKGIELVGSLVPVRTDDLEWALNGSVSTNESEIIDISPLENIGFSLREGQPLRVEYDNIVTNPGEVGVDPIHEAQVTGVLWPEKLFTVGTRLTWRNSLTIDALLEGHADFVKPSGISWAQARRESWPHCWGILDEFNQNGITNLTTQQQSLCAPSTAQWGTWTDRSDFWRLRSASISYRLPDDVVPYAQSASISLQGKNLFTITDYVGLDPEGADGGLSGGFGGTGSQGLVVPTEYYNMGPPRIFILSATVNF